MTLETNEQMHAASVKKSDKQAIDMIKEYASAMSLIYASEGSEISSYVLDLASETCKKVQLVCIAAEKGTLEEFNPAVIEGIHKSIDELKTIALSADQN